MQEDMRVQFSTFNLFFTIIPNCSGQYILFIFTIILRMRWTTPSLDSHVMLHFVQPQKNTFIQGLAISYCLQTTPSCSRMYLVWFSTLYEASLRKKKSVLLELQNKLKQHPSGATLI